MHLTPLEMSPLCHFRKLMKDFCPTFSQEGYLDYLTGFQILHLLCVCVLVALEACKRT